MDLLLPDRKSSWETAAARLNIPSGLLSAGQAFRSGSNFSESDFLRLRIIHKSTYARQLFLTVLPKASVKRMAQALDDSTDIKTLREILPNRECIQNWTSEDARKSGQFSVGLEHLALIATLPEKDDVDQNPDHDPLSSRIINSPRIRRPVVRFGQIDTNLSDRLSKLQLDPQTPTKKANVTADMWDTPISLASASTEPSFLSPKDPDLEATVNNFNREMFQAGDEQTVNACLVALIIPLASILGSRGRVRLDRKPFQVLKKNAVDGRALYEAQVDGIIMGVDGKEIESFMEVKRALRGRRKNVRMQEGAQMAAFIYSKGRTAKVRGYDGAQQLSKHTRR